MSVNTSTAVARGPQTQRSNDIYACDTELPPIFNRFDKTRKADQFLSFQSQAEASAVKTSRHMPSGSRDMGRGVSFIDDPRVVRKPIGERQASPSADRNQASEYYQKIQAATNQVHDTLREYNLAESMIGEPMFDDSEEEDIMVRGRKKNDEPYDPRARIMAVIEEFFQKDHDLVLNLSNFATEAMATQPAQEKRLALVEGIVNDNAEETEANLQELYDIVDSSNKAREGRTKDLNDILKSVISYAVQRLNSSMGKRKVGTLEDESFVAVSVFNDLKLRLQVYEMKCSEQQQKLQHANTVKLEPHDNNDSSMNHESVDDMRHRLRGALKEVQRLQELLVTMSSGDAKTALDRELMLQKKNNQSLEQIIQGLAEEKAVIVNQKKQLATVLAQQQQQQQQNPSIQSQNIQSPATRRQQSGRLLNIEQQNLNSPLPALSLDATSQDSQRSVTTAMTGDSTNKAANPVKREEMTIPQAPVAPAPKKPVIMLNQAKPAVLPQQQRKVAKSRSKREDMEFSAPTTENAVTARVPKSVPGQIERVPPSKSARQARLAEPKTATNTAAKSSLELQQTPLNNTSHVTPLSNISHLDNPSLESTDQRMQIDELERDLAVYRAKETKERIQQQNKKEEDSLLQRQVTLLTSLLKSILQGSVDGDSREEARQVASELKDRDGEIGLETAQVQERIARITDVEPVSSSDQTVQTVQEETRDTRQRSRRHSSITLSVAPILSAHGTRRGSMVSPRNLMTNVGTSTEDRDEIQSLVTELNSAQLSQQDIVTKLVEEIQQLQAVLETVQTERENQRQQLVVVPKTISRATTAAKTSRQPYYHVETQTDPMLVLDTPSEDVVTCFDAQNMQFGRDYIDVIKTPMTPQQVVRALEKTSSELPTARSAHPNPKHGLRKLHQSEFNGTKVLTVNEEEDYNNEGKTNSATEPLYSRIFAESQSLTDNVLSSEHSADLELGPENMIVIPSEELDEATKQVAMATTDKDGLSGKNAALLSAYTVQLQYLLKRRDEALKIATHEAYEWKHRYMALIDQLKTAKKRLSRDVVAPEARSQTALTALQDVASWIQGMELGGGGGKEDREQADTSAVKVIGVVNEDDLVVARKMVIPSFVQSSGGTSVVHGHESSQVLLNVMTADARTSSETPSDDQAGDAIVRSTTQATAFIPKAITDIAIPSTAIDKDSSPDIHPLNMEQPLQSTDSSPLLKPSPALGARKLARRAQHTKLHIPDLPPPEDESLDSPVVEDEILDLDADMTPQEAASLTTVSQNQTHEYKGFQSDWIPKKDGLQD